MSDDISLEILGKAKEWFKSIIAVNHISNTRKLKKSSEFNINPFLAVYLNPTQHENWSFGTD
jgi:hypothetical protein